MGFGLFRILHAIVVVVDGVLEGVLHIVNVDDVLRLIEGDGQRRADDLFELVTVDPLILIAVDDIQVGRGFHSGLGNILDTVIIVVHGVLELILDVVDADDIVCRSGGDGQRLAFDLIELVAVDDLVGVGVNDSLEGSGTVYGFFGILDAVIVVLNGVREGVLDIVNTDDVVCRSGGDGQRLAFDFVELVAVNLLIRVGVNDILVGRVGVYSLGIILHAVIVVLDGVIEGVLDVVNADDIVCRGGGDGQRQVFGLGKLITIDDLVSVGVNNCLEGCSAGYGLFCILDAVVVVFNGVREGILDIVDVDDVLRLVMGDG